MAAEWDCADTTGEFTRSSDCNILNQIVVKVSLTIAGTPGGGIPTLWGGGANRLFFVTSMGSLVLKDLVLKNGGIRLSYLVKQQAFYTYGSAIFVENGLLEATRCTFSGHETYQSVVSSENGDIVLESCSFENNVANNAVQNVIHKTDTVINFNEKQIYGYSSLVANYVNSDSFALEIETTPKAESYPRSHVPFKFRATVTGASDHGLSIGHGYSSNYLQVRMADGSALHSYNFQHPTTYVDIKCRRVILVEKVSGGRNVRVFVNDEESTSGTIFFPVVGDIYQSGDMIMGDVWGWKFEGTLHKIAIHTLLATSSDPKTSVFFAGIPGRTATLKWTDFHSNVAVRTYYKDAIVNLLSCNFYSQSVNIGGFVYNTPVNYRSLPSKNWTLSSNVSIGTQIITSSLLEIAGIVGVSNQLPAIVGSGTHRLFLLENSGSLTLTNVVLANGNDDTGAVAMIDAAASTIFRASNCVFEKNQARGSNGFGGAIFLRSGNAYISACKFLQNGATFGGAIMSRSNGNISIANTVFDSNTVTTGYGGALYGDSATNFLITGGEFKNNASPKGGDAVAIAEGASLSMSNTELFGNDVYSRSTDQAITLINVQYSRTGLVRGSSVPLSCTASPGQCQENGFGELIGCRDRDDPQQGVLCDLVPVVMYIVPNNQSSLGNVTTSIYGDKFGTEESIIQIQSNGAEWTNVIFHNSTYLTAVSPPGTGVRHAISITVDGISSKNELVKGVLSYLPPRITHLVSPPFNGGTVQIYGEHLGGVPNLFSAVVLDGSCIRECTDIEIIGASSLVQCQYDFSGRKGLCLNVVVHVDGQNSNQLEFCYNLDKGEMRGFPSGTVRVMENEIVSYEIDLSPDVIPTEEVHVQLQAQSTDNAFNCTVVPERIVFPANNRSTPQPIAVTTDGNFIDEGSGMTAYRCKILHSMESEDAQYASSPARMVVINVVNDDNADVKLWTVSPKDSNKFEYDTKFIPFYVAEGRTVEYGIQLYSEPRQPVYVRPVISLEHSDTIFSPQPELVSTPTQVEFTQTNWDSIQRIRLHSVQDEIDHDVEQFQIEHEVSTEDKIFLRKANIQRILAVVDVNDDDTRGIKLLSSEVVSLSENGNGASITLSSFMSQPVYDVNISVYVPTAFSSYIEIQPRNSLLVRKESWANIEEVINIRAILGCPNGNIVIQLQPSSKDPKYNGTDAAVSVNVAIYALERELLIPNTGNILEGEAYIYSAKLSSHLKENAVVFMHVSTSGSCALRENANFEFKTINSTTEEVSIEIIADDNFIDEGGYGQKSLSCEVYHVLNCSHVDCAYYGYSKTLALSIQNDDVADIKLLSFSPERNSFDDKLKTLGPLCLDEGENITYGIVLDSMPMAAVNVSMTFKMERNISPLILKLYPDVLTIMPIEWDIPQKVVVTSFRDFVDNDLSPEMVRVHHSVQTEDDYFKRSATNATMKLKITDHIADVADILLHPEKSLSLDSGGAAHVLKILRFSSLPLSTVNITVVIPPTLHAHLSVLPLAPLIIFKEEWARVDRQIIIQALKGAPGGSFVLELRPKSNDLKYGETLLAKEILITIETSDDDPETNITKGPPRISALQWASFSMSTSGEGVELVEWRLDMREFTTHPCQKRSCSLHIPFVAYGKHRFEVRSVTTTGRIDGSPAVYNWEVAHCNHPNRIPDQYAEVSEQGDIRCIDCPHRIGANCRTIDAQWNEVFANEGWWTSGSRSDAFYECPFKDACTGGIVSKTSINGSSVVEAVKSRCKAGYKGIVCAVCDEGYYLLDDLCIKCLPTNGGAETFVSFVFGTAIAVFIIAFVRQMRVRDSKWYWKKTRISILKKVKHEAASMTIAKNKEKLGKELKIFVGFVQILSVSDSAYKIPWPDNFLLFLRFLSPFNFDFLSLSGLGCIVKYNFFHSFITMMTLPLFVLVCVFFTYTVGHWRHQKKLGKKFTHAMQIVYSNHIIQFSLWIILLVYPPLSRRTIEYFTCSEKLEGKYFLSKDYNVECYAGEWNTLLVVAIGGLLAYPIGIPAYFGIKLWQRRNSLDNDLVIARYGFLFVAYNKGAYMWDVYEMLRKLFLTGVIVLIFPGKSFQVVVAAICNLCFLTFLLIHRPHLPGPGRTLAEMSSFAITVTMFVGLVLKTVTDARRYGNFLGYVLILVNGSVALYTTYIIIETIFGDRLHKVCSRFCHKKHRTQVLPSSVEEKRRNQQHIVHYFAVCKRDAYGIGKAAAPIIIKLMSMSASEREDYGRLGAMQKNTLVWYNAIMADLREFEVGERALYEENRTLRLLGGNASGLQARAQKAWE